MIYAFKVEENAPKRQHEANLFVKSNQNAYTGISKKN